MAAECRVILGVTGASGSVYAERLLRQLLLLETRVYVVFTSTAEKVVHTELETESLLFQLLKTKSRQRFDEVFSAEQFLSWGLTLAHLRNLKRFDHDDMYAPIASGSARATHMVIIPASMGAVARISHGVSGTLLERSADVMLKERRPLVVVPRETPFSTIHLGNLLTLAQAGAHILPAMPGFYHRPQTVVELVDFVVERVLDSLEIPGWEAHAKMRWNSGRM